VSDYQSTWQLRQQYYSDEAVEQRETEAMERDVSRDHAVREATRRSAVEAAGYTVDVRIPGPEEGSLTDPGVIGAGLRRPTEEPKGRVGKTADTVSTIASNVGERALDAVPSVGLGLISMADNVLDFGAHLTGLEDHYNELAKWSAKHVDLYEPTTSTGPIVSAISQITVPYAGTAKVLNMAGMSKVLSGIIAAGTAEGLAIAPGNENFAEMLGKLTDTAPEAPELVRWSLLDAYSKTDEELRILAQGEQRKAAGLSLEGEGDDGSIESQDDFDPEAYREVYFNARLKNALAGVGAEVLGEALILGAKGLYRTMRALKDPTARQALGRTVRNSAGELLSPTSAVAAQRGQIEPFLEYRRQNEGALDSMGPEVGARAVVASPVESAQQLLDEAVSLKGRNLSHQQLAAVLPPETRRAGGLPDTPRRHTTRSGGRFADENLEAPAAPNVKLADEEIDALWHESIEFMERQGYPAQQVINEMRAVRSGGRQVKSVRPKGGEFWERSLKLPNRARYWYEVSAEGMRDMLPDLSDEEFKAFIDLVAMTSQSTAPTQNMMRAIGVLSHTLRDIPSEQDIIDPTTLLRTFGQANEGLKVGSFGGTFLHHLGLRDMPQLSTNDRQVASTFGMGPTDVAQNPVMYGVLSRFYQNLRDHLNVKQGANAEPWETWQLQAMGWVQERIDDGNVDFDDYLDVLSRLSKKAEDAGLPVGPNGELTREVLSDPRLDPLMATTIEEYRRKVKVGLPITGRGDGYHKSVEMRREFELLDDQKAVEAWDNMERRALKGLMFTRRVPKLDAEGKQVFSRKREKAFESAPSPAQALASALAGKRQGVSRTAIGANEAGAVGRIPLPADASETELKAWLSVMGSELQQNTVRAGRFRYLEAPPEDMTGKGTSVLYQQPEPLTAAQVQAFQARVGEHWQVDAHTAPNGTVLDVHPLGGRAADPAVLEAAVRDSGLNVDAAQVVFSEYTGVAMARGDYAKAMTAWKSGVVRAEAEKIAKQVGGMSEARAIIQGKATVADEVPGGKAFRERVSKAQARVRDRFAAVDAARRSVREVREQLDADAAAYVEANAGRLERRRAAAQRRDNNQ